MTLHDMNIDVCVKCLRDTSITYVLCLEFIVPINSDIHFTPFLTFTLLDLYEEHMTVMSDKSTLCYNTIPPYT